MGTLFPPPASNPQLHLRHEFNSGPLDARSRQRLRTVQAVVAALERLCKTLGSVSQAARHLDTSRTYLSMILSGRKSPSRELAVKLGYTPVLMYVRNLGLELEDGAEGTPEDGHGRDDGAGGAA